MSPDTPDGNKISALVVEDNAVSAHLLKAFLHKLGAARVTCVPSIHEAIREFSVNDFNLIVCDIELNGQSGLKFCHVIRQAALPMLAARADVPIIVTTGHAEQVFIEAAKALKVNAYLVKPVTLARLAHAITHHCELASSSAA